MAERQIMWQAAGEPGMEYLFFTRQAHQLVATGSIVRVTEGKPVHCEYQIEYDVTSHAMRVSVFSMSLAGGYRQTLSTDGRGRWFDANKQRLLQFEGCHSADITLTPFTNTLAIRHLNLKPDESGELSVVYFDFDVLPTLSIEPQRYTCIDQNDNGAIYKFEHLSNGFSATLAVDHDDLVIDYPELFRRVI